MCFSIPVQPVYGESENDLRAYRPHPTKNNKGKIIGYSAKEYDVHVSTTHSTEWNLNKMTAFVLTILRDFQGAAYTYISVNVDHKDGVASSAPLRLLKDAKGNITYTKFTWELVDAHLGEDQLQGLGYAKINLYKYFGSKNKVNHYSGKFDLGLLQLDQF